MKIKNKALSLIELLISIAIMSIIIVGIYSVIVFSTNQIVSSSRKSKVQADLGLALEHISKYSQQAIGNLNNPAFEYFGGSGFRMRVDFDSTPSDLSDDAWVRYRLLPGNTLEASCVAGAGNCPDNFPVNLSTRIISGFTQDALLPDNPDQGFYVMITSANTVEIGLVGRYFPTQAAGPANPQIEMKTKIISNSASSN